MENSKEFLNTFIHIEKHLRKLTNSGKECSFYALINKAKTSDAVVKRFEEDLKEFADLRNAIVHERTDSHVLAEPHERTVDAIKSIYDKLINPSKVIPACQGSVIKFDVSDSLADVLKKVKNENYSQFPIYENKQFKGLLTDSGITNWLARNLAEDIISFSETLVKEVLIHEELSENFIFVSRELTLYQAKDYFSNKSNSRLDALLITQHGKQSESLIGIVTASDVIHVV